MATFKVSFQRVTNYTGYVESADLQDAVNKLNYPCKRNSDGEIVVRYSPGDDVWEMVDVKTVGKIVSMVDIGAEKTLTEDEIPEAVKPDGW